MESRLGRRRGNIFEIRKMEPVIKSEVLNVIGSDGLNVLLMDYWPIRPKDFGGRIGEWLELTFYLRFNISNP
jgi:hypothetical protein